MPLKDSKKRGRGRISQGEGEHARETEGEMLASITEAAFKAFSVRKDRACSVVSLLKKWTVIEDKGCGMLG